MSLYYDKDGSPLTLMQWCERFEDKSDPPYKRVAEAILPGGVRVSTMWLGLDHSFSGGPPLIFETMVFGTGEDDYQRRWSTIQEALDGHRDIVATLLRGEALL